MSKIFYPSAEKLRFLLESIHNREVALPDFQRDFVWDARATEELIESICQNFPAGSLLRIKNSAGFYFAPHEFAGAPSLNGHSPSYLILDGQQRLTSLYQALYGTGDHRYFIHLQGLIDGRDLEDCVFFLRKSDARRQYGNREQQAATLTFPLEKLLGAGGFEEWLDEMLDLRVGDDVAKKLIKQQLRQLHAKYIETIEDYEFPVVTLSEDTSAAAVCTIFETLNRTGVKLSVFDLLAARFWPENVRLRDMWKEAQLAHPIIAEFDVDPYYVLQSVALFAAGAAPSCKRQDVLGLNVEQIRAGWQPVVDGLAQALHLLRNDCGVILPGWLPYNTIIIPAAAAMASAARARGADVAATKNKMRRWFWCSVFGQSYENAPNSQSAKDLGELKAWIAGGEPPQVVRDFVFRPEILRETTPRQRAIYRGVIALMLRHGAQDFHSGDRVTASMMLERKIDDHHVFPQAYLAELRPNAGATLRDCVLNRVLVDKETNVRIGRRAPADYLGEIESAIGASALREVLESHLLPDVPDSPLRRNDFDAFISMRQEAIAGHIREVTS